MGDLRWREPQPAAHWEGVRKADQFSPVCMQQQRGPAGASGPAPSEDCLYVNVWTAAKSASERRPVIVWTYGGGFTGGAGSLAMYNGEALAKKGAVVVTYNYRLGIFGFLAHPELTKESGAQRVGQLRADGHGGGAALGAKEYREFRRRSEARHHRRRVGRVDAGVGDGCDRPQGKGLFQRAIGAERRMDGNQHRQNDDACAGRRERTEDGAGFGRGVDRRSARQAGR